jgi:hypothetical protein
VYIGGEHVLGADSQGFEESFARAFLGVDAGQIQEPSNPPLSLLL